MPVSSSYHGPPSCVTCNLLAPCGRALTRLFRVPVSTVLAIRAFRFRSFRKAAATMSPPHLRRRHRRRKFRSVRAVFWPLVPSSSTSALAAEDEALVATRPTTELLAVVAQEMHGPVSSPETPAYVKVVARLRSGRSAASCDDEEEGGEDRGKKEEACRSFESCLMEMLVEEGKARDLQDMEELLRCWDRLKSPVFVDLVCRFYGELCNDMFPATVDDDDDAVTDGGDALVPTSCA